LGLGFFKLTMKSSVAQAMAKVVALARDKAHPMVVNPPRPFVACH